MLEDAIQLVIEAGEASASLIQRRLGVGYPRAARLMDLMDGAIGIYSIPGGGSIFWIDCNISPAIVKTDYLAQEAKNLNVPVIKES